MVKFMLRIHFFWFSCQCAVFPLGKDVPNSLHDWCPHGTPTDSGETLTEREDRLSEPDHCWTSEAGVSAVNSTQAYCLPPVSRGQPARKQPQHLYQPHLSVKREELRAQPSHVHSSVSPLGNLIVSVALNDGLGQWKRMSVQFESHWYFLFKRLVPVARYRSLWLSQCSLWYWPCVSGSHLQPLISYVK